MSRRLLILALPLALLLIGGSAGAAAGGSARVGTAPAHPTGSHVLGALSGSTPLHITIGLDPRDPAGLTAYATEVSTPGTSLYHHYLSVAEFADRFGATPATIASVRAALIAEGLTPSAASANGLSLSVSAPASTLARAFDTSFQRVRLHGGRTAYANTAAPRFRASIAGAIEGVVGLDTLTIPHPLGLIHRTASRAATRPAAHAASGHATAHTSVPAACATASSEASSQSAYTTNQIASAYNFGGVYSAGDFGSGVTVALYELEGNFPSDITAFESCYGVTASVSYKPVDGGAGTPNPNPPNYDGLETELDIENVIGIAPAVNAIVYQAPNSNSGAYDNYRQMITDDTAKVISTSWGECEAAMGKSAADMENTLFQEAATQGQTIVAAAGDDGAQDCFEETFPGTKPAVDDPASQPFVTGAGGTSLTSISPRTETVWNDGPSPANGGAGGGGNSTFWTMPSYQSSAPASLNVINSESAAAATCGGTTGDCREVPDVTASADEDHAYLVYWHGNGSATDSGAWTAVGGTSGAAPLWGALFALTDAQTTCATPLGLANADLYSAAAAAYSPLFNDITTGNNDMLGINGGEFAAGPGYDQASGLGSPNAVNLVPALCAQETPLTVTNPGAQSSIVGAPASLQLKSNEASGVTYSATGLPPGLSIASGTGLVSGTPTTAGTYTVTVDAADTDYRAGSTSFTWTVSPDRVTLAPVPAQHGVVKHATSLQLKATDLSGRPITYGATGLPKGLKLTASTGRIAGTPTKAGIFHVTASAEESGVIPATQSFTWTIAGAPRISVARIAKSGGSLSLKVVAGSHAAGIRKLSVKLPAAVSGVISGKAKVPGARSVKRSGRTVTIVLRRAVRTVKISIRLRPSATITRDAKRRRLSVKAVVRDAGGVRTTVKKRVRRA